ncbi:helix-turn-helix domain-containing protein [Pyrococcus kukulkanii]|uniref:helix-turn-helix domain-containing protein n=1 Tax=Pyrococcus kukulkanii TaxID=1609559 RepID=UPI00356820A8
MKGESRKKLIIDLLKQGKGVSEVAREVGVSRAYVSQVKKELEMKGHADKGKIEAEAFKLLKKGKRPEDLVIELEIPAEEAMRIYKSYLVLHGYPSPSELDVYEEIMKAREDIKKTAKKMREEFYEMLYLARETVMLVGFYILEWTFFHIRALGLIGKTREEIEKDKDYQIAKRFCKLASYLYQKDPEGLKPLIKFVEKEVDEAKGLAPRPSYEAALELLKILKGRDSS